MKLFILSCIISLLISQNYTYTLEDINPSSNTYEQTIGPDYFQGQITLHYFGHQYWTTCIARVEQLNDLYQNLQNAGIQNVKIIAIGKGQYSSDNAKWTDGNSIPVVTDPSPNNLWTAWNVNQWDLFFLDANAEYVTDFNINPWDYDAVYNQISSMIEDDNQLNIQSHPEHISLLRTYPNPFNPSTTISFTIPRISMTTIIVYDLQGKMLKTLSSEYLTPGNYTTNWNAAAYPSGEYLIQMQSGSYMQTEKVVLIK